MGGMIFRNTGYIRLHTTLSIPDRAYLSMLALIPGIMPKERASNDQLFSIGACLFFAKRPWLEKGWEWQHPSAAKTNPEWVAIHPQLVDVPIGDEMIPSSLLHEHILALAAVVPKMRSNDSGKSLVTYSIISWALKNVFPRGKNGMPNFSVPVLTKDAIPLIKLPVQAI